MEISNDTLAVISFLDEFTDGNLRKKNDITSIIELCATYNGADVLNRLIFSSKSVWNISNKLKKANPNIEGIGLLQKEMERACNEMINALTEIIQYAPFDIAKRFEDIYLQLTRGSIKNLIDLAFDLSKLKELQQIARQKSNK